MVINVSEIRYEDLVRRGIIPAGSRTIVRLGKDRYLIYLPRSLNYVWEELKERNIKIRVYIEIPNNNNPNP